MLYVRFHFTHTHMLVIVVDVMVVHAAVQGRPDQCYEAARLYSNGIRIISHHQGAMEDRVGERGSGETCSCNFVNVFGGLEFVYTKCVFLKIGQY